MNAIIKPVITEKSMAQAGKGIYAFIVSKSATKENIKKAVQDQFNVTVIGVKTMTMKGKVKRVGQRRVEVKEQPVKKAYVEVKAGEKISMFSLSE